MPNETLTVGVPPDFQFPSFVNGDLIDLAEIPPSKVLVEDIAKTLSHINRFNGRTPHPYSVAQHAVFVSMLAGSSRSRFARLHHDDGEAFTGDLISPIKRKAGGVVGGLLRIVDDAIADGLGLTDETGESLFDVYKDAIHTADTNAYFFETHILQGRAIPLPSPESYGEFRNLAEIKKFLGPMHHRRAEELYLSRHFELATESASERWVKNVNEDEAET